MTERELEELEERFPEEAVKALNAAHQRAIASGLPLVMVIDGGLYRISGSGTKELIRMLPPRIRVQDLKKGSKA